MKTLAVVCLIVNLVRLLTPVCDAPALDDGWERKAAFLVGASAVEDMSEEVMEKFASLHERPLDVNAATRSRLLSTGLLNDFQAAALLEYRCTYGDILSFAELALLPGFSAEYAEALRPFVILRTGRAPGVTDRKRAEQELILRSSFRRDTDPSEKGLDKSFGLKYAAEFGERAEFRWSTRTTYDDGSVKLGTLSAAWYGKRALGKLILGNYSARFGQGLAQWSGFVLNGFPTVASFRKNGTGISPTGSFTPELKGVASEWNIGRFTLSGAASLGKDNIASLVNLKWTGRTATVGSTCVWSPVQHCVTASADWRVGLPEVSLFGEAAVKAGSGSGLPFAGVAGMMWTPEYGMRLALTGRYYDPSFKKEWSGAALGFENPWMSATLDAARNISDKADQYKTVVRFFREFSVDSLSFTPSVRMNARYRPDADNPKRIDLRGDVVSAYEKWRLNARVNTLWCKGFSWLWYAELGWENEAQKGRVSLFSRFSLFRVDNWDDRIYVYERDAPGSFNVPAYYGRGYAASMVGSLKRRRHAFYLRAAWTSYPWNLSPKPGRFELKIQYALKL